MVFLNLLGNALGSCLVIWGVMFFGLLLMWLCDWLWWKVTGRGYAATQAVDRWRLQPVPGVLVQFWYAGYAASLVHAAAPQAALAERVALYLTAVLGVVLAVGVFHAIYRHVAEVYKDARVSLGVGAGATAALALFLACPPAAALVGGSWSGALKLAIAMATSQ